MMDRLQLIAIVADMIANKKSAEVIVDVVVNELTPEDGDQCPVCGICP